MKSLLLCVGTIRQRRYVAYVHRTQNHRLLPKIVAQPPLKLSPQATKLQEQVLMNFWIKSYNRHGKCPILSWSF